MQVLNVSRVTPAPGEIPPLGGRTPKTSGRTTARPDTADEAITCFTPGTAITTMRGQINVESLRVGDRILTRDHGFQSLLWTGTRQVPKRHLNSKSDLRPVLVRAGALGLGMPERDLMVSPRHRLLTTNAHILDRLNENEALIEARCLVGQPGVTRITPADLSYIHLLFEQHEIILSDNTWSESFHLGRPTASALLKTQHKEITSLFPQLKKSAKLIIQPLARICLSPENIAGLSAH